MPGKKKYLADYRPFPYEMRTLDLSFSLSPQDTIVDAVTQFRAHDEAVPMWLDGEDLQLRHLAIDGEALAPSAYRVTAQGIEIYSPPKQGTLHVRTKINPAGNTKLSGLYMANGVYCTQCEPEGFRAISYFPDRPDVLTRITTTITCKDKITLLGNGNPYKRAVKLEDEESDYRVTWRDPYAKPVYLFALVGGVFDVTEDIFVTKDGRQIKLSIYVEPGKKEYSLWAMECLKKAMRWDEERYNCIYDLDVFNIVAVPDFNFGAMENKGLNLFNDKYLLVDESIATDRDYENVEAIVAHEYFHNWTGNRITCRDWFQLCLKEGLTVFREQQFVCDQRDAQVMRIEEINHLQNVQFPEDAGPLSHAVRPASYIEINNFYTTTVYQKGAELIHMIFAELGEEAFYKGMEVYFSRHDAQAVTIEDFLQALSDGSGRDVVSFLPWYQEAGTPHIRLEPIESNSSWAWRVTRTTHDRKEESKENATRLPIPMRLAFFSAKDGALIDERTFVFQQDEQTIELKETSEKSRPVLSVNRGFGAPMIVHMEQEDAFLAKYESDPYKRWESLQKLKSAFILSRIDSQGRTSDEEQILFDAFVSVLKDKTLSDRMRALLLALPNYEQLIRQLKPLRPHQLVAAMQESRQKIATHFQADFRACYEEIDIGAYAPDAWQCGRRIWRGVLLKYLDHVDQKYALSLLEEASNMTDRMQALSCLVHHAQSDTLVESMMREYRNNFLVLDLIHAQRALAERQDTHDIVLSIYRSPAFNRRHPNRLYSLIGAFSQNLSHFHDPEGRGYDLIEDVICSNDSTNPQVAARFARIFARWRIYAEPLRSRQKQILERILKRSDLSTNVYEIASKSLEA